MVYLGGKANQAKRIVREIRRYKGARTKYIEPFVGAGSVLSRITLDFDVCEASDIVPDLIMLWQAIQKGWIPPLVSKYTYEAIKNCNPSALRGWAGFGASFRGKWFSGYSHSKSRNYQIESRERLLDKFIRIQGVSFVCRHYKSIIADSNSVIYCDPPYMNTEQYQASGDTFDTESFWSTARVWARTGAIVFVSEFTAPRDAHRLFSEKRNVSVSKNMNTIPSIESLYVL